MTSARIPEEDACLRARNLCVFSRVQKGTPGLTHTDCVLQRVSLGALSDVTVVLRMRQSIGLYFKITALLCFSVGLYGEVKHKTQTLEFNRILSTDCNTILVKMVMDDLVPMCRLTRLLPVILFDPDYPEIIPFAESLPHVKICSFTL